MDLPADRGPADAGTSGLARDEWDDLRRRLEQLPPGHPSRLDGEDRVDQETADEGDGVGQRPGGPDSDRERGRWGNHEDSRERHAGDTSRARPGGPGDLSGPGGREPYRPWFTAGESPEPWFAADSS